MYGSHRLLIGVLAAGVLALPALSAAPKKPAPKKKPAVTAKAGDAKAGKEAFKSEGCTGCHKSKDFADGGMVGPDLSAVAKEKKPAEITAYITKPKAGSVMPAFKGPKKVLSDITAYLATQK